VKKTITNFSDGCRNIGDGKFCPKNPILIKYNKKLGIRLIKILSKKPDRDSY